MIQITYSTWPSTVDNVGLAEQRIHLYTVFQLKQWLVPQPPQSESGSPDQVSC